MKPYRNFLRIWLAITSVLSFIGGWIILAHSLKPVNPTPAKGTNELAPLPTLPPIQTFGTNNNNGGGFGLFSSPNNRSSGFGFPTMRTGGS